MTMSNNLTNTTISAAPVDRCLLCGGLGREIHSQLRDNLFGSPGVWSFMKCLNPKCGLLWLNPHPDVKELGKLYFDYYTHAGVSKSPANPLRSLFNKITDAYLGFRFGYRQINPKPNAKLLALLPYLHPGRRAELDSRVFYLHSSLRGRLLEIGCGSGEKLSFMRALGWDVEGIDFDPVAVQIARANGLSVNLGSLEEQRLPSNSYRAVVLAHVIEHVPDPVKLMSECKRILKPGGVLVVITPNAHGLGHRLFGSLWRGLEPPRHLQIFGPASLSSAARMAGFMHFECGIHAMGRYIFGGSLMLLKSKLLRKPSSIGLPLKLLSEALGILSFSLHKMDGRSSEEIVLRACKESDSIV